MEKSKIDLKKWLTGYCKPIPKKDDKEHERQYYFDNTASVEPVCVNREPLLKQGEVDEFLTFYTIDDSIVPDFWFERSSTHDGTHLFTIQLILRTINSIIDEIQLYGNHEWAGQEINLDKVIITNIEYTRKFLKKVSNEQPWAGQKDSMKIGVKLIIK